MPRNIRLGRGQWRSQESTMVKQRRVQPTMQGQWLGEAAALREQWWWSRGVFRQRWWWGSPNTITLRSGSSDGGTEASEGRTMRGKRCSQQWRIQKIFKELKIFHRLQRGAPSFTQI